MTNITAFESITLDGVMQGPGRPDEDARGGFTHGGWGNGFQDDVSMQIAGEGMAKKGGMLFGHRTYDDLMGFWANFTQPNPFTEVLLNTPKYVVSRSAETVLDYPNSTVLAGDAAETVAALKESFDGDLTILGSGELVRSLHAAGLVDHYTLLVHPIVLGSGTHLFSDADRVDLRLERSVPTTTGVVIAQYSVGK